jgi:hypothetical protein
MSRVSNISRKDGVGMPDSSYIGASGILPLAEHTHIRITLNGTTFELRSKKPWTEVMDRCGKDFASSRNIGGPELPPDGTSSRAGSD